MMHELDGYAEPWHAIRHAIRVARGAINVPVRTSEPRHSSDADHVLVLGVKPRSSYCNVGIAVR